jgi:hydroxymethylpyrimidine/phosphomethylpyrimidine kinase
MRGRVLAIAGSDSGGGAGIQADVKTITALDAYAATAITAITVQDRRAMHAVHPLPPALIGAQIACALADPGADAVKTGMLVDAPTIMAVAAALHPAAGVPLVVDPVMLASSGARLLAEDALAALREALFPLAALITPNVPEAERLSGVPITDPGSMRAAALAIGARAVLVKGGHLPGDIVVDVLVSEAGTMLFEHPRIPGPPRHGTGCTLASAIAAGLAQGMRLPDAVRRARAYVQAAIATAPAIGASIGAPMGSGAGLLDHAVTVDLSRLAPPPKTR